MKIDRLIGITMYLLNRDIVSASTLAEHFEVSIRTIQRDVNVLNQAGIPIVSTFGTDGGYSIIDGFKLTKQIAGAEDYINIITALKGLSTAYESKEVNSTLEKVLVSMQGRTPHIFVDFSAARDGVSIDKFLNVIDNAISNKISLKISYANTENYETTRIVEPIALSYQWHSWYLFAYCQLKQDYRLFKLPRIISCEPTNSVFTIEHENAETLFNSHLKKDNRTYYNIRMLCKGEVRQQALEYLSSNIVYEHENGDFEIVWSVPMERMWFSLIMGFGDKVEVLEPKELRDMLKERAEEILSVYDKEE